MSQQIGIHPGFKTQDRRHQKSKSVAQRKELMSSKQKQKTKKTKKKKKTGGNEFGHNYECARIYFLEAIAMSEIVYFSFAFAFSPQVTKLFLESKKN